VTEKENLESTLSNQIAGLQGDLDSSRSDKQSMEQTLQAQITALKVIHAE